MSYDISWACSMCFYLSLHFSLTILTHFLGMVHPFSTTMARFKDDRHNMITTTEDERGMSAVQHSMMTTAGLETQMRLEPQICFYILFLAFS
jgi:hypothetical protein